MSVFQTHSCSLSHDNTSFLYLKNWGRRQNMDFKISIENYNNKENFRNFQNVIKLKYFQVLPNYYQTNILEVIMEIVHKLVHKY